MLKNFKILLVLITPFLIWQCIEETDPEKEKPVIELLSPLPCDTLTFGDKFNYQVKISDNSGMGFISMDVHHNFGHHNHGDHESCKMDAAKEAVHPYSDDWVFSLPSEQTEFTFDTLLSIPKRNNDSILFDSGDYHFHIYVTDNEGYQTFTTMDVKVLHN